MPEFSLARTFRNRGLLLQTGSQFSNSAALTPFFLLHIYYMPNAMQYQYIRHKIILLAELESELPVCKFKF